MKSMMLIASLLLLSACNTPSRVGLPDDRAQIEAGQALGLRVNQTLRYELLPQAMRQILPTWVNSSTEIAKAST
ncbi:hypothetical protein RX879_24175, partial [Pseudomonas syringae pv. actinidiae]|nr:hypothetical protein [Pseudomonas syringae pv. actinidiae]